MFSGDCLNRRNMSENPQCGDWHVTMAFGCQSWLSAWRAGPGVRTCYHLRQWLIFEVLLCAPQCICTCSEETQALGKISKRKRWVTAISFPPHCLSCSFTYTYKLLTKEKPNTVVTTVNRRSCGDCAQINTNTSGVDITRGWRLELLIPLRLKQELKLLGWFFFSPTEVAWAVLWGGEKSRKSIPAASAHRQQKHREQYWQPVCTATTESIYLPQDSIMGLFVCTLWTCSVSTPSRCQKPAVLLQK